MTGRELVAAIMAGHPDSRVNCLEVQDRDTYKIVMWKIVNIHEDLTGIHLIIERVG